jgi:hypothetical protein
MRDHVIRDTQGDRRRWCNRLGEIDPAAGYAVAKTAGKFGGDRAPSGFRQLRHFDLAILVELPAGHSPLNPL